MNSHRTKGPVSLVSDSDVSVLGTDMVIPSTIEAGSSAIDCLARLLRTTCFPSEREFAVETVLREALANAIIHGNRLDPRKSVRVCFSCDAEGNVLIVVTDEGEGFDPSAIPSPITGENIGLDHGRGIYLINRFADEVHFERAGARIQIRMSARPK
jgi:serine/threonine-protein kinase RsbW